MDSAPAVIIAAISSRALAVSARRGGYLPLAIDFFGDQDTLQAARAHVRLRGDLAHGFEETTLVAAIETVSECHEALGIVCGAGFEDRPQIVQQLAVRWQVFGNSAGTIERAKNPELLSTICADLGIGFPEVSLSEPAAPADWLVKRRGGAGGVHIKPALEPGVGGRPRYYQRKMPGNPVSALFLADGKRAQVLGLSEQWSLPTARQPYRYGGAVRPAAVSLCAAEPLRAAVHRLAAALSLVGLNSADFLLDGDRFYLLEINPRPSATLDIFDMPERSLFARHMAACAGKLGAPPCYDDGAKATAIVYADHDIASVPELDWPQWTADRPQPGCAIKAGGPLCTVYACASAAAQAKALAEERRKTVLAWVRGRKS